MSYLPLRFKIIAVKAKGSNPVKSLYMSYLALRFKVIPMKAKGK